MHTEPQPISKTTLLKIAGTALAIRWVYSLALFAAMGDGGLTGVDSIGYLEQAHLFADRIGNHSLSGWKWAGTDPYIMPLFTWLLGACVLAFGKTAPLGYVLLQGIIDSGTCCLVSGIAQAIDVRAAKPTLIAAAINPTQIVFAGMVYSDTPFAFFVALFLFGAVRWLSSTPWRSAIAVGVGLGGGILFRSLLAAWALPMLAYLAMAALIRGRLHRQQWGQLAAILVIFSACTAVIFARNAAQFGVWSLTPQTGMHLARWIVPLTRQASDGTPWRQGYLDIEKKLEDRFGEGNVEAFELSRRYSEIATEELRKLGVAPILKAWAFGAAINLGSPAIILSPPIAQMPRQGFYDTAGTTMMQKIWNFLFREPGSIYALALLSGIAGVAAMRLIQIWSVARLLTNVANYPAMLLFAGWVCYILVVNGPVASPKYRLPIEPVLVVMTGIGWASLTRRFGRAR